MRPTPILFLSDSPDLTSGLARITRDLCAQLSASPRFRVGSLGLSGHGSRHLPWQQYQIQRLAGEWGQNDLKAVWADFAGRERGVVMTIWDPIRLHWMARPHYYAQAQTQQEDLTGLSQWLQEGHFAKWAYLPIDATGPGDRLSSMAADCLLGFDRLLCYTKWAQGVVERSLGPQEAARRHLNWLPHGLDGQVWQIRDREQAKQRFGSLLHEGDKLIGVVGTNQPRKDWGLMAETCRRLLESQPNVRFWWHTDLPERYWSIPALLADYGLDRFVKVTYYLPQDGLVSAYNACDLTLHPGAGEGFGYPIFESLACGTPVVHGNYGGGADVLQQCELADSLIPAESWHLEGRHNNLRPVYNPNDWLNTIIEKLSFPEDREGLRAKVSHLFWSNLFPSFSRWFEEGLGG